MARCSGRIVGLGSWSSRVIYWSSMSRIIKPPTVMPLLPRKDRTLLISIPTHRDHHRHILLHEFRLRLRLCIR